MFNDVLRHLMNALNKNLDYLKFNKFIKSFHFILFAQMDLRITLWRTPSVCPSVCPALAKPCLLIGIMDGHNL